MDKSIKTFGVVRLADAWTILALGKRWGRFAFRVDAEEAVLRLAERAGAQGELIEILVQGPCGEMERLAPSGTDGRRKVA